jgi:hypothetical protein
MVRYCPYCRKPVKYMAGLTLFLSQVAALNGFILFKKFTKTKKDKSSKFRGFVLDCIWKMTELAQREDESLSTMNQSPQHNCRSGHCQ